MKNPDSYYDLSRIPIRIRISHLLLVVLMAAGADVARGADWSIELAPVFTDLYGHDQHVLTIREIETGSGLGTTTGVTLDTGSTTGYRGEFRYARESWGAGIDFFFVTLGQKGSRGAAAGGGIGEMVFEVADAAFSSSGPEEVLYYDVLEDTDVNAWTFDLYGTRVISGSATNGLELRLGLRVADFDNDYRAVVGIAGAEGLRFDASSNYGAMPGPLVGLTGRFSRGNGTFEGDLSQSIVVGEAELSSRRRTFAGPFSEDVPFLTDEEFRVKQDIAIPIMDLRLEYRHRILAGLSLGVGAHGSAWWDVSVPPGVIPGEGGGDVLHENTLLFYGFSALFQYTF